MSITRRQSDLEGEKTEHEERKKLAIAQQEAYIAENAVERVRSLAEYPSRLRSIPSPATQVWILL